MSRTLVAALLLGALAAASPARAQQSSLAAEDSNAGSFRGQPGRRLTFVCPERVLILDDAIWGTDFYTDNSRICLSALHAGAIPASGAAVVTLILGGRRLSFEASAKNGVTSGSSEEFPFSFRFDNSAPGSVDWTTSAKGVPEDFPDPIVVRCPANGKANVGVYGTDVYTEDSPICVAAVHAGVIQRSSGGLVAVTMTGVAKAFRGSAHNGVTSQDYDGEWAGYRLAAASGTSPPASAGGGFGVRVTMNAAGVASVSWDAVPGATGYVVVRWKVGDAACCNNLSPPGAQLAGTTWVDTAPLPSFGTYGFRVYATTATGIVAAETTVVWNGLPQAVTAVAPPATALPAATPPAVAVPAAPGAVANGPVATTAAPPAAAAPPTATALPAAPPTATALPTAAPQETALLDEPRYRVTLQGAVVGQHTKDNPTQADGRGDEIYGVAAAILWDRRSNLVKSRSFVRTAEYGDVGTIAKADDRIAAGNVSTTGGLQRDNVVPTGFDPATATITIGPNQATPTASAIAGANGQFPLVVWEGPLAESIDALLVVPSVWERNVSAAPFNAYKAVWLTGDTSTTLASPFVAALLLNPRLETLIGGIQPGLPTVLSLADLGSHLLDRPIGLTPTPLIEPYSDRFFVLTREKLAALTAVGSSTRINIAYSEPNSDPVLGGSYTLSLFVERTR